MSPMISWGHIRAIAIHCYTASGAVCALLIVFSALNGASVTALWFGLVALLIDSTDGLLVRHYRVMELTSRFDGRRLDDIVDYLTYVFAPVLLLWITGFLPPGPVGTLLAALPILASCYQFCRADAKTEDHFFLGFPSYWNVLTFYAIVQHWTPTVVSISLIICSILVFVPIRYLYPSRTRAFRTVTLVVSALWICLYAIILLQMPSPQRLLVIVSCLCVAYYVGMSVYLTWVSNTQQRIKQLTSQQKRPTQPGSSD